MAGSAGRGGAREGVFVVVIDFIVVSTFDVVLLVRDLDFDFVAHLVHIFCHTVVMTP